MESMRLDVASFSPVVVTRVIRYDTNIPVQLLEEIF